MDNETIRIVVTASSGLVGAVVGGGLTFFSAPYTYKRQKKNDTQRECYGKIMSLRLSLVQRYLDLYSCKIRAYSALTRSYVTGIKKYEEWYESLLKQQPELIKSSSEAEFEYHYYVGLIYTCFNINNTLKSILNDILEKSNKISDLLQLPHKSSFKSEEEVIIWSDRSQTEIHARLINDITPNIDRLIEELNTQMNISKTNILKENPLAVIAGAFIGFVFCFVLMCFLKSK